MHSIFRGIGIETSTDKSPHLDALASLLRNRKVRVYPSVPYVLDELAPMPLEKDGVPVIKGMQQVMG